jgi:hypothetical protein
MADSLDEFFYDNVIDTSSDESDDDTEIRADVALLVHDHESTWARSRDTVRPIPAIERPSRSKSGMTISLDQSIIPGVMFQTTLLDVKKDFSEDYALSEVLR